MIVYWLFINKILQGYDYKRDGFDFINPSKSE